MSVNHRLSLFPISTQIRHDGDAQRLTIGGCDLAALAATYGTPLYLYDQATMDAAVHAYRQALAQYYPGEAAITYAGKAFLCTAVAQWTQRRDLWLDCTGEGELAIAKAAQMPNARTLVHGVNKSERDLRAALAQAAVIVVDNLSELTRILALAPQYASMPELWLRIRPGVAVETHAYTQTGQADSKFGMALTEAIAAIAQCRQAGVTLSGLHFHQGSHFHDPAPVGPALQTVLDLVLEIESQSGWHPQTICPGGGWGVPYHEDDLPHPSIESYVQFVAQTLAAGCQERQLALPRLVLEPGRSLVAQAGVALYRVGAVKQTPARRWLLIDGGLADNPRPALYGARYSALPVAQPLRPHTHESWLAGPFCESGDVLIEALPLPAIEAGEVLAVPVSGAYQLSMGSNYNGARRPAVLWLHEGQVHLVQQREELSNLTARDCPLPHFSPHPQSA
ncbi:MAG: diaminopimelate decarboxylase [Caldilineaceae bacterium]|nr:diaminopimelate decarboxylase [Caldilineaceae bacterium]